LVGRFEYEEEEAQLADTKTVISGYVEKLLEKLMLW